MSEIPENTRLIIVSGLPGAGKTTLARKFEATIPAIRLCPDEWMHDMGIDYGNAEARIKLEKRLWRLGQELLKLGNCVVLEYGYWGHTSRDEIRGTARAIGAHVELHYLEATEEELWRRLQVRNAADQPGTVPLSREQLNGLIPLMRRPTETEIQLFDKPLSE